MHVALGRQVRRAEAILAEENADVHIDCSSPCGQEPPKEIFPKVFLLAAFGARKCHSCKGEILRKKYPTVTVDIFSNKYLHL